MVLDVESFLALVTLIVMLVFHLFTHCCLRYVGSLSLSARESSKNVSRSAKQVWSSLQYRSSTSLFTLVSSAAQFPSIRLCLSLHRSIHSSWYEAWNTASMNCWNRSVRLFFFVFGSGGESVNSDVVLGSEELLSVEAIDDMSVSKSSLDGPRLFSDDSDVSVSSSVQGVLIAFVLRCMRCLRSY